MQRPRGLARGVILLMLAVVAFPGCDGPRFVDIVLVNETNFPANVQVRSDGGQWLALSTVPAHDQIQVEEVIDQGSSWFFRFSYGRHDAVEIALDRADLVDSDWTIEVPDALGESLQREGVPPPP